MTPHIDDRSAAVRELLVHESVLLRHAHTKLGDWDGAADAVQETMIAAWQQWGTFRGDAAVRTWLFSICTHKIADIQRGRPDTRRVRQLFDTTAESTIDDPHRLAVSSLFSDALRCALTDLPATQRSVWVMREVEGTSFVDIGHRLGLGAGTVRGHHSRATICLARRLAAWR